MHLMEVFFIRKNIHTLIGNILFLTVFWKAYLTLFVSIKYSIHASPNLRTIHNRPALPCPAIARVGFAFAGGDDDVVVVHLQ